MALRQRAAPDPTCTDRDCIDGPTSVRGPVVPKAVGDINGDHYDDLVLGDDDNEPGVRVAFGSADGPSRRRRSSTSTCRACPAPRRTETGTAARSPSAT
ncbi:hypothetical protein [Streptomyces alboniger]|uniref:hypothetical protein n=1 Tax=Streptomyces alboniger TaxID=132473 RepID=UPI000B0ABC18|nr:hypothetical protein [Streptomyces alboniger]